MPLKGYKMKAEHKLAISNANRGHRTSVETRKRISTALKGFGVIHGQSTHRLYPVWRAIINRCLNPNDKNYFRYKDRGICNEWLDIKGFLADMESSYFEGAVIDRIDNKKGYSLENCRWTSQKENMRNTMSNKFMEYNGEKRTIAGWADKLGMKIGTLWSRIDRGWPTSKVLTTPVNPKRSLTNLLIN